MTEGLASLCLLACLLSFLLYSRFQHSFLVSSGFGKGVRGNASTGEMPLCQEGKLVEKSTEYEIKTICLKLSVLWMTLSQNLYPLFKHQLSHP